MTVETCSSKRAPIDALAEIVEVSAMWTPVVASAQSRVVGEPGMGMDDFGDTVHHLTQEQIKHLIFNFNLIT